MSTIHSYESFEAVFLPIQGQPLVVEALWELRAERWYLGLSVYVAAKETTDQPSTRHFLGFVAMPENEASSVAHVSQWPEAVVAQQIGQRVTEEYGVSFYFPSDTIPDDQCPSWSEQNSSRECLDCHQAFMPGYRLHENKTICVDCHILREANERSINQELNNGANLYFYKEGTYEKIFSGSHIVSISTIPYLPYFIPVGESTDTVREVIIEQPGMIDLHAKLQKEMEVRLSAYQKSDLREPLLRYANFVTFSFQGVAYELEINFNHAHRELADAVSMLREVERALEEGLIFKFYLRAGMTNRTYTLLSYVDQQRNGQTTSSAINDHFKKVLSEEEINDTLSELERNQCVLIKEEGIFITHLGKYIL